MHIKNSTFGERNVWTINQTQWGTCKTNCIRIHTSDDRNHSSATVGRFKIRKLGADAIKTRLKYDALLQLYYLLYALLNGIQQ